MRHLKIGAAISSYISLKISMNPESLSRDSRTYDSRHYMTSAVYITTLTGTGYSYDHLMPTQMIKHQLSLTNPKVDHCHVVFKVPLLRTGSSICFKHNNVRRILMLKMIVFWDVAPCSLVQIYRCFRDDYCPNHDGNDHSDIGDSKHF
jgi:hypothetical protein